MRDIEFLRKDFESVNKENVKLKENTDNLNSIID